MIQHPNSNILRVVVQNVNGIRMPHGDRSDLKYAFSRIQETGAAMFGLTETNIDWKQPLLRKDYTKIANQAWSRSSSALSSSNTKAKGSYLPGGTALTARGKWSSRTIDSGYDDMGRWSYITLIGRGGRKLTCITAYRTCDQSPAATTRTNNPRQKMRSSTTAYTQQYIQLAEDRGIEHPDPRERFITDIITFIKTKETQDHDILLMGDFNENIIQGSTKGISRILQECALINLLELRHEDPTPNTYIRGTHTIDHVLGSPAVADATVASGMLGFHECIFSDHRALYIDINHELLFDGKTDDPVAPASRRLVSSNPRDVKAFLTIVGKYWTDHRIIERQAALRKDSSHLHRQEIQRRHQQIDQDIGRAIRTGENKIGRRRQGRWWSPTLAKVAKTVQYWKIRVSELKNNQQCTQAKHDIRQEVDIDDDDSNTWPYLTTQLRASWQLWKKTKLQAAQLRDDHLMERATALAVKGNINSAQAVTQIRLAEQRQEAFRQIKSSLKPSKSGNFAWLETFNTTTEQWETITDGHEIQDKILRRNLRHFRQANGTTFATPEMYSRVGQSGLSTAADTILKGSYHHPSSTQSSALSAFLKALEAPPEILDGSAISNATITPEEFSKGIQKWRESTSTSPSGRHLGIYKTLIKDEAMLNVLTDMGNLCFENGFAADRWLVTIQCVLEKDPGVPRLHRVRIIHLLEADMNLFLKIHWSRRMISTAEKFGWLHPSQHGGRPGHITTDPTLIRILNCDLSRLTLSEMALADKDAMACYDRMVNFIMLLASRRLGVNPQVIDTFHQVLSGMKYHVKTAHGISNNWYTGTPNNPTQGPGQGSSNGPALWTATSSPLLEALAQET